MEILPGFPIFRVIIKFMDMEPLKEVPSSQNLSGLRMVTNAVIVLLLMLVSFGAGLYLAESDDTMKELAKKEVVYLGRVLGKYSDAPSGKLAQDVDFKLFWEVWDTLHQEYVDKNKINEKELFYGAIKGMVSSLGDPYTVFMDPKISAEFENDLAGTFEGIGAEIGLKNNSLTIIAPLPDMPAEKAGLRAGDKILFIDKKTTTNLSVDEAVSRIRGPKDTDVTLTIFREGFEAPKDFVIKRGKIVVKSVRTTMRDDKIFVIELTNFNNDTRDLFDEAVRKALDSDPKGIILDLRNNPGGYLDTAIEVASEWVEDGAIVTEQFTEDRKEDHLARGRARLKSIPTVVLINEGSASASEIVSGALKDNGVAKLVGKQSFGKGSVQTVKDMIDGSSVKITVAKWLTPNGTNITEKGITPDVEVAFTNEDYNNNKDPQLDKAVEILTGKSATNDKKEADKKAESDKK